VKIRAEGETSQGTTTKGMEPRIQGFTRKGISQKRGRGPIQRRRRGGEGKGEQQKRENTAPRKATSSRTWGGRVSQHFDEKIDNKKNGALRKRKLALNKNWEKKQARESCRGEPHQRPPNREIRESKVAEFRDDSARRGNGEKPNSRPDRGSALGRTAGQRGVRRQPLGKTLDRGDAKVRNAFRKGGCFRR